MLIIKERYGLIIDIKDSTAYGLPLSNCTAFDLRGLTSILHSCAPCQHISAAFSSAVHPLRSHPLPQPCFCASPAGRPISVRDQVAAPQLSRVQLCMLTQCCQP